VAVRCAPRLRIAWVKDDKRRQLLQARRGEALAIP